MCIVMMVFVDGADSVIERRSTAKNFSMCLLLSGCCGPFSPGQ